jgi:putative heme-binding domain-containing protein
MRILRVFGAACFWITLFPAFGQAQNPHWIWHDDATIKPGDVRYFRKTFNSPAASPSATLQFAADDKADVFLNGKQIGTNVGYNKPLVVDAGKYIKKGKNALAVRGENVAADMAGIVAMLEMKRGGRSSATIVTDEKWKSSATAEDGWEKAGFDDSQWSQPRTVGKMGDKPWGAVFTMPRATDPTNITIIPKFKVELVHNSEPGEGSWICMTTDDHGRFIISPQADDEPMLRLTVKKGKLVKTERIEAPVHQAMGLLYAFNSLYANAHGPQGTGLYRLIDANHNDRFESNEVHFLSKVLGEGEHGYHALTLGPDKMIYMMNGNHTKLPPVLDPASPHKNFEEELLLPRQWDANGHAVGILAPGGHVLQTDRNGKNWKIMLAGFRNAYDFAFNADGELFTFDSDMEWDWGLPWYRPTRVNHCVTGAEFGWRSGSAVWPEYYPDSLPATVNIGIGCPTGMKFGTQSNFPEYYRKAFFMEDWSYGRLFAVHMKPQGASYSADFEEILRGKPLNMSSIVFGKDGALYFITGGRGVQSGLYRVTYVGDPRHEPALTKTGKAEEKKAAKARKIRRKLESFYGHKDPRAIEVAWPYLGSQDRFLSYASRIALEFQDVNLWKERALNERNPDAALTGLLGLARSSGKESQRDLLMALTKFPMDSLSLTQKLDKLRVVELSFIRQGKPDADICKMAMDKLDRLYPANNEYLNRELSQLLIYLEAPDVVTKTLALLDKAKTQEEQVHYIFYLRTLTKGWTLDQRKHYFDWFKNGNAPTKDEVSFVKGGAYHVWTDQSQAQARHPAQMVKWFRDVDRDYGDGVSYPKYLINIRNDAIAALPADEKIALAPWIQDFQQAKAFKPVRERKFVREWTVADLEADLPEVGHGRNFKNGKDAFNDAQCMLCHRFGNEGGYVGPELTAVSSRFSRRDVLESIIEPSKVVSDQFQNYTIVKKDGDSETGRIMDEDDKKITIQPSPLSPDRVEIPKSEIQERRASHVSPMPEGLLNSFTKEDILDILAYIESSGKEKAANFKAVEQAKH